MKVKNDNDKHYVNITTQIKQDFSIRKRIHITVSQIRKNIMLTRKRGNFIETP